MDAGRSHAEDLEVGPGKVTLLPTAARPGNLPVALSSFVGRERELGELHRALADTRLLTLTGAGGCGKTRLALRVASELVDRFPGGVWWVELAPLGDERLVGAAVAEALGVRPLPGVTELQAACGYLASRRALLVLDNCEHLLEACAKAAEGLLMAGPDVVVLATGRAPLGVGGETDWRVPSLSLPRSAQTLVGSDAAQLFLERARKVRPGFAVRDDNADAVARVCTALDGLPLALELAAARVRMLSVEQIAAGLSDRFGLLTGGPRTASGRHQTLRASVDWSHDLLSDQERVLLRRLGFAQRPPPTAAAVVRCGTWRAPRSRRPHAPRASTAGPPSPDALASTLPPASVGDAHQPDVLRLAEDAHSANCWVRCAGSSPPSCISGPSARRRRLRDPGSRSGPDRVRPSGRRSHRHRRPAGPGGVLSRAAGTTVELTDFTIDPTFIDYDGESMRLGARIDFRVDDAKVDVIDS
jgi:hypothetical protein